MLQRNMVKCNCHRLKYLVLYYKRVIALILRNSVPRSTSYSPGKLVQYDTLLETIFLNIILYVLIFPICLRILTGPYFSIWTGPDQYNVFFRILSELVFCLGYTITKTCRLTDLHVLSII
jgi:hypothetical protein